MRILLLNDDYFLDSLKNTYGCEVFFASPAPKADFSVGYRPIDLLEALEACPFQPDIILMSDAINLHLSVKGLDKTDIPAAFYGIDAPMNAFWQRDYAAFCDLTFLDQKAEVETMRSLFPERSHRIHWLPLAADPKIYRRDPVEKLYDVAFVGSLSFRQRPKRTWILRTLKRHFDIRIFDGGGNRSLGAAEVARIYNQSKIVLNENLFPGVNLRTFEVMACGTCLMTEESDGSWKALFRDGEHLVTYRPENLIERMRNLLENDQKREAIAEQGMREVLAEHTVDKRAGQLLMTLEEYLENRREGETKEIFHLGRALTQMASRWPEQPVAHLYEEGMRLLMNAVESGCESADLHYELAAQALENARPEDACASIDRALELDPGHLRTYWAAFWCHRELKNLETAAMAVGRLFHHFQMERKFYPVQSRVRQGEDLQPTDYLLLGQLLEKAGWILEPGVDRSITHPCRWNAFDLYQKAIELNPKLTEAYRYCADILDSAGIPEFAVLFAEQAVKLRPWDGQLTLRLVDLLLRSHRRREALQRLVHYLVNFTDADKWDAIESIPLNEEEYRSLLAGVWDACRKAEGADENELQHSAEVKRVLKNILRLDPDFETRINQSQDTQ
jgi:tetratricopeptide (TPR) repeat protein